MVEPMRTHNTRVGLRGLSLLYAHTDSELAQYCADLRRSLHPHPGFIENSPCLFCWQRSTAAIAVTELRSATAITAYSVEPLWP